MTCSMSNALLMQRYMAKWSQMAVSCSNFTVDQHVSMVCMRFWLVLYYKSTHALLLMHVLPQGSLITKFTVTWGI